MKKGAYKVVLLSCLSAVLVAYTNCGKQSNLNFTGASQKSSEQSESKVSAFSKTVYQVTRANCAGCHTTTSPTHAAEDPHVALEAIENQGKINWSAPENSRLVLKLKDENHNCWGDCTENSEEMLEAIINMKEMLADSDEDPGSDKDSGKKFLVTSQSRAIQTELDDTANPTPSNTVRLNLEAAMITPPMAKLNDSTRGTILTVPNANRATKVSTDPSAGVAYLNFDVRVAGSYRMWLYTNAPGTEDNGFFARFDNNPYVTFDPAVNGSDYGWMLVPSSQRNLTVGRHTFELREKKDGTKVNAIIITADGSFNGVDVGSFVGVTLSYDISSIVKTPNVRLLIDVADYDPYSYKLLNPRIISPTENIYVKNMRILLNKYYSPQNSAYTDVDKVVTPMDSVLSPFSTVIAKDKGISLDRLSFEFEVLEIYTGNSSSGGTGGGGTVDPVASLNAFRDNVYNVSRNNQCVNCHRTQFPEHASNNAQIAHDVLINEGMVDFSSPQNSRLYRKVKVNRHNCGSTTQCDNIAAQYLNGIDAWGAARGEN